jgi:hypothetical protein
MTNLSHSWDKFLLANDGCTRLYMWWLLYDLLVLLQDLLQLSVLLHYSLILEAHSMLLVLLPVCCCSLQLF